MLYYTELCLVLLEMTQKIIEFHNISGLVVDIYQQLTLQGWLCHRQQMSTLPSMVVSIGESINRG